MKLFKKIHPRFWDHKIIMFEDHNYVDNKASIALLLSVIALGIELIRYIK